MRTNGHRNIAELDTVGKIPKQFRLFKKFHASYKPTCTNSDLWKLEVIGNSDTAESKRKTEMHQDTLQSFRSTLTISEEGMYEVALNWMLKSSRLPDTDK